MIDRAEDILASILNLTAEGVIVADGDLRILVFSSGAEAIFGYAANEVLGRSVEILIPQEFRRQHRDHVDEFKSRKQTSSRMRGRMQTMGLTRSGELKPVEVDLSRLQAAQGEIITAIVRDVTERVETERLLSAAAEAANTANHAKSAFLAAMSHEIRTPLNGILGMAQAMAQDELPTRQRERLAVLRDSGASLLQILNDLLDLSKIESGKLTLEEAEFDIEELLRSACAAFASLAAQKGLAYELKVSEGARGRYRGDPLRLRQILHNLISNAIKFTEQGRVEVAVSRRGGRLVMVVRDTGIGIPRDRVSRIFDRFEQADVSTTRRFGGTGLGLAICHELVRLMGGTIQVRSEPGRGTVFRVEAPTPRVSSAASSDGKSADAAPGTRALRILVAEDNPTNQIVIRSLLEAAGLDCVVAPDGAAALEAWQAGEWDVILMDVQMPVMDGPTATAAIRAIETEEGGGRIPILGVTANAMAHQIEEYIAAGMDGVIAKPIQLTELLTAIGELVE
ncbi:ATP-binding protein [Brevundimonas sp.]|uniref:ATP-binding protein n=1 Tax=Brevundimonas sp. TaxID=1871086 RepID=UPI0025C5BBD3|nr:ATP-binding protein [Brevundimonas sp.]